MTRTLCLGGVLVFIIPRKRLAVSARYLAAHYEGYRLYRFPDPEYAAFHQIVLFARRKQQAGIDPAAQAALEHRSEGELDPLPDEISAEQRLAVPAVPAGEVLFSSLYFDPEQAAMEAKRRGVWRQSQFAEHLWPPDERPVRPLMPLRKGHLALLIAAGMLNNITLERDGQQVLVKGRTHKEFVTVEGGDENTQVEREVIRTSVMMLNLATGKMESIRQGSALAAAQEGQAG